MNQQIDISPQQVTIVANASLRFLSLETTLWPGNLKQQLSVLEAILGGLASGKLQLAPVVPDPVELETDKAKGPNKREPTAEDLKVMAAAAAAAAGPELKTGAQEDGNNSGSTPSGDSKA